jgi:hypothetical protein
LRRAALFDFLAGGFSVRFLKKNKVCPCLNIHQYCLAGGKTQLTAVQAWLSMFFLKYGYLYFQYLQAFFW